MFLEKDMQFILGKGHQCSWKRTCSLSLKKDTNVLGKGQVCPWKRASAAGMHKQFWKEKMLLLQLLQLLGSSGCHMCSY